MTRTRGGYKDRSGSLCRAHRVGKGAAWVLAAGGAAIVAFALAYERCVLGLHWLREGPQTWSRGEVVVSMGLMFGSALAAVALFWWSRVDAGLPPGVAQPASPDQPFEPIGAWVIALVGMAAALLLVAAPDAFSSLAREDGVVENASAMLALLAAASAIRLGWKLRGRSHGKRIEIAGVWGFGLACFLIAGEEVSWLQRVVDWQPAWAERNGQRETNLHNFSTDTAENIYYFFGGFVALVLLPTARALGLLQRRLAPLSSLVPGHALIGVGALISAFNYDMATSAPTQIAFWGSMFILVCWVWHGPDPRSRRTSLAWLALAATVQAVFLTFGDRQQRPWDVTEYKELLIPAALLLWSIRLWGLGADTAPVPDGG